MEDFDYIGSLLEEEINTDIEGEICSIVKDKTSSTLIFLEKIKDSIKNMVKFRLHILFWDFSSLLENKKQKSKLSYPLIFKNSDNGPVKLKNCEEFRRVEMKLNVSSKVLAINLGENLFCGVFDSRFLMEELKKKQEGGIIKKKNVYILMTLIGNHIEEKKIFSMKFHPKNDSILSYIDQERRLLCIYDVKYNIKLPLYEIDISQKVLKSKSCPIDYCYIENNLIKDFSNFSLVLMTETGNLYSVGTLILPYTHYNQDYFEHGLQRIGYLQGGKDEIYSNEFRKFLKGLKGHLNVDFVNGKLLLTKAGANAVKDMIPPPSVIGPLKIIGSQNSKERFSFFKKVSYVGNDFLHSFCLLTNTGRVKFASTFFPFYPIWIVKDHISMNKHTKILPQFIQVAEFKIFDQESEDKLKKKESKLINTDDIEMRSIGESVLVKISSKILNLNFKWVKRIVQNFIDYKEKRNRDRIFKNEVRSQIEENTVTTIYEGENEIQFFEKYTNKMYFLIDFKEGDHGVKFVNTEFKKPKTGVKKKSKIYSLEGILAPLKQETRHSKPNTQFQDIINTMKEKINSRNLIPIINQPEISLDRAEKEIKEISSLKPELVERFTEYLKDHTNKLNSLNVLSLETEAKNLGLEKKISGLDTRLNTIQNRNKGLKNRIILMLKKLDHLSKSNLYSSGELQLVEKLEDSLKAIQRREQLANCADEISQLRHQKDEDKKNTKMFMMEIFKKNKEKFADIMRKHNKIVEKLSMLKRKAMIVKE